MDFGHATFGTVTKLVPTAGMASSHEEGAGGEGDWYHFNSLQKTEGWKYSGSWPNSFGYPVFQTWPAGVD